MSFLIDDERPRKPAPHEIGQELSQLSLEELTRRIALLHEEIARLETAKAAKSASRAAAEDFFKS